MKKIILLALVVMSATCMSAAKYRGGKGGGDYTHALGFKVGNELGLTYKGFIFGVDGLALQADLGFKMMSVPTKEVVTKDGHSITENYDWTVWTFEVNPNVVYQKAVASVGRGSLCVYGGGGVSLGLGHNLAILSVGETPFYGKFGINAATGLEFVFNKFILGLDFKPGYGLAFSKKYYVSSGLLGSDSFLVDVDSNLLHFFDWSVGLSFKWSI